MEGKNVFIRPQDVYVIDAEMRTVEKRIPSSSNKVIPTEAAKWGTYGRFRYVPSKIIYVLVSAIDESIFVYRLSDSAPGGTITSAPGNLTVKYTPMVMPQIRSNNTRSVGPNRRQSLKMLRAKLHAIAALAKPVVVDN